MCINVAVICLNTLFYFIDLCLKNPQVVSLPEPDDPLCVCGPKKCKIGKCWGFNRNITTKRARPNQLQAASEAQQPLQAASVSPTSPTKSTLTVPARSLVGTVAKKTYDAAVSKQEHARHIAEKHVCNHCTKCTVGSCSTCKCDKCKACQPIGKRLSALRPL